MSAAITDERFEALTAASRDVHGNMFVLPVAFWVAEESGSGVSVSEIMRGLQGRVDRHRIIEALERLCAIGAMEELPRPDVRNAPRFFDMKIHPYWAFVAAFTASFLTLESGVPDER